MVVMQFHFQQSCLALRYEALVMRDQKAASDTRLKVLPSEWLVFAQQSLDHGFYSVARKVMNILVLLNESEICFFCVVLLSFCLFMIIDFNISVTSNVVSTCAILFSSSIYIHKKLLISSNTSLSTLSSTLHLLVTFP